MTESFQASLPGMTIFGNNPRSSHDGSLLRFRHAGDTAQQNMEQCGNLSEAVLQESNMKLSIINFSNEFFQNFLSSPSGDVQLLPCGINALPA